MNSRTAKKKRQTNETTVVVSLELDGYGDAVVETGIGFLDHMFISFARHSRIDLELRCSGDLEIDDHHTAEDCAIVVGIALDDALGDRSGIRRFGSAYAPLDEALARTVVDLSGRSHASIDLGLRRERIGTLACENIPHVFQSLASNARMTLHVDVLRGENDHHRAEAAFKSFALALRDAISPSGFSDIASSKGVLGESRSAADLEGGVHGNPAHGAAVHGKGDAEETRTVEEKTIPEKR